MNQLENTDAVILMQFRDAIAPVLQLDRIDPAIMKSTAAPFLERLKANGHEWPDALALMRAVIFEIKGVKS